MDDGVGGGTDEQGNVRLVTDERGGVTVMRDGHPQSHVQLDDPTVLAFEYVQHMALVADLFPAGPLATTHVGGAGLTLARYVAHTRPGSPQIVLEPDATLTETVRRELPLPRGHRIRVRATTGEEGIESLRDDSAQLLALDAYAAGRVPATLLEPRFLGEVARVLAPDGAGVLNIANEPGLRFVARAVATLAGVRGAGGDHAAFSSLAVVATHDVLKGRRFGNVVVVAARGALDLAELRRRAARSPFPTGVRGDAEVRRMSLSAKPFRDGEGAGSPVPPELGRWRVR